jgi:hypothetical protein
MARRPIYVETPTFSESEIAEPLQEIVGDLSEYLTTYPSRGYTRHAIMGPLPGIFDKLRSGETYLPGILGEALRKHEMASESGYVSPAGQQLLDRGVQRLAVLVQSVPITYMPRLLEKVELGVYYERRKASSDRMERIRQDFVEFLQDRYAERPADLLKVWKINSLDVLPYPARTFLKGSKDQAQDVQAFAQVAQLRGYTIEEDEEAER